MEEHKTILSLDVRYYADSSFRSATAVCYDLTRLLSSVLVNSMLVCRSIQGFHISEIRAKIRTKIFLAIAKGI